MKPQITEQGLPPCDLLVAASKELRHEAADHDENGDEFRIRLIASKELRHEAADHL